MISHCTHGLELRCICVCDFCSEQGLIGNSVNVETLNAMQEEIINLLSGDEREQTHEQIHIQK
jgi:hypothetical protein